MERRLLLLPVWLIAIVPASWVATIPISYVFDALAIMLSLLTVNRKNGDYSDLPRWRRLPARFAAEFDSCKSAIWRTWIWGLIIWLACTALMLIPSLISISLGNDVGWLLNVSDALLSNPFTNPIALSWAVICVAAGFALVYIVNLKLCLRKTKLEPGQRARTALMIAILTAPYIFLIPYQVIT